MISEAAIRTIHEACKTDLLYVVIRRDGTAWIMEGDNLEEIADKAESLWNQLPLSVIPIIGVLPIPNLR